MKKLILVRHADAEQSHNDHQRALSASGERAASEAGKYLAQSDDQPQRALVSSALRATQTWDKIQAELLKPPPTEIERALYLAEVDAMHAQILAIPESIDCAVLVAHNPGISELAVWLTARGSNELMLRLERGFAPAAVASLSLDVPEWARTRARCGEIRGFWGA